jgi:pimeloyl-ACP methyl ester carboxylesterase
MGGLKKILLGIVLLVVLLLLAVTVWIYAMPEQATATIVNLEREHSGLTRHEMTLSSSEKYVYLEGGLRTGEPLLLLHGFGANKDNFTRIAAKLGAKYHLIIPDEMGFAESSHRPDADYRTDAQATRLHELVARLKLSHIHIGGNSMGGHIAMAYAAKYPKEVGSLWLLDAGGVWSAPPAEVFLTYQRTGVHPLWVHDVADYKRVFSIVMTQPPFVPSPILAVMAQPSIANEALERKILPVLTQDGIESRAKGLTMPTLIVWGDQDRVLNPKAAEILKGLIPYSRVIMMKGIGHLPMLEDVNQTAEDYLEFRRSLNR